jgi:hypothetical protein
MVLFLFWVGFW